MDKVHFVLLTCVTF